MRPSTLILLPDQFSDPIRIIRVDDTGKRDERYASLTEIRTGEDGTRIPSIRRYETGDTATAHLTDLVNARVVVTEQSVTSTPGGQRIPEWARRSTALHPDRHDLATWLEAAQSDPTAPWISHLALVVRDALRHLSEHHPTIIALPDRAFLAASDDDAHIAIDPVIETFSLQAHEISEDGHRTGTSLAPMPISTASRSEHRGAIITRAQAVIAEALVNAVEAQPVPTVEDLQARWGAVVSKDHAGRLRADGRGQFSAPVALLDDHNNNKFTATLILATVRISIAEDGNNVWLEYHHAHDINAARPFDLNLTTSLLRRGESLTTSQNDLLACLRDQALPVLELSTTPSGDFANRDMITAIPDASPLFREHLGFSFPDAILAFMMFREPATFETWWSKLFRPAIQGGDDDSDGAENEDVVADTVVPPSTVERASEAGDVGVVDNAPDADTASEGAGAGANADESEQSDDETEDAATGQSSGDGLLDGSGQARLDPPSEAKQASEVADAIAGVDDSEQAAGDDIDMFGGGSDVEVADQPKSTEPAQGSDGDAQGSEAKKAHEEDQGTETTGSVTVAALLSSISDSDRDIIKEVRGAVTRRKKGGVPPVPTDAILKEKLGEREAFYDKVWKHLHDKFTKPDDKSLSNVRRCLNAESRWLRLLFLLNLTDQLADVTQARSATKAKAIANAKNTLLQCDVAQIAIPAEPTLSASKDMGGMS